MKRVEKVQKVEEAVVQKEEEEYECFEDLQKGEVARQDGATARNESSRENIDMLSNDAAFEMDEALNGHRSMG